MRRKSVGFVIMFALVAFGVRCGSSKQAADIIEPEIRLALLSGSSFAMQYPGRLTLYFVMQIENHSAEAIELQSVELRTVGDSPYSLQTRAIPLEKAIQPGETETVEFPVAAVSRGGRSAPSEPVTIRGMARFDSEVGSFRTIFTELIVQTSEPVEE